MFGLSPTKILFTALVIAAVWYGFKWLGRVQEGQKKPRGGGGGHAPSNQASHSNASDVEYEELVPCPKCGDYVIADKRTGCGKEGCPYDK